MSTPGCEPVREALSAALDDEAPGLASETVDAHLGRCAPCRRHAADLRTLAGRTRLAPARPVPDLSASIVAAVADAPPARGPRVRDLRVVVALAGVVQLAWAVPLLLGLVDAGGHLGRDLGAFELALGVGFLLAAWQPHRAAGVLPVAAVVAGAVLVAASVDLLTGRAALLTELPHVGELIGVAALWALCRRLPSETSSYRPAEVI